MSVCSIEGCERTLLARGWCATHYQRWRVHGSPLVSFRPELTMTIAERLWSNVDKDGPIPETRPELGPCWMWTKSLATKGYGQLRVHGKKRYTHRVAYELLVGVVPEGLELDHLCRNPACCNPAHLEPVTHAENVRRGIVGDRQRAKTHCVQGHPFDRANAYVDAKGFRHCRVCGRATSRRYQQKMAAA